MVHIERKCPLEAKNIAKTAKNGIKKGPATETLFDIAGPFSYITLSTRDSPKATHIAEISLSYIFITALKTIFFLKLFSWPCWPKLHVEPATSADTYPECDSPSLS